MSGRITFNSEEGSWRAQAEPRGKWGYVMEALSQPQATRSLGKILQFVDSVSIYFSLPQLGLNPGSIGGVLNQAASVSSIGPTSNFGYETIHMAGEWYRGRKSLGKLLSKVCQLGYKFSDWILSMQDAGAANLDAATVQQLRIAKCSLSLMAEVEGAGSSVQNWYREEESGRKAIERSCQFGSKGIDLFLEASKGGVFDFDATYHLHAKMGRNGFRLIARYESLQINRERLQLLREERESESVYNAVWWQTLSSISNLALSIICFVTALFRVTVAPMFTLLLSVASIVSQLLQHYYESVEQDEEAMRMVAMVNQQLQ